MTSFSYLNLARSHFHSQLIAHSKFPFSFIPTGYGPTTLPLSYGDVRMPQLEMQQHDVSDVRFGELVFAFRALTLWA